MHVVVQPSLGERAGKRIAEERGGGGEDRSREKRLGGHWGRGGTATRAGSEPLRPDPKAQAGHACVLLNRNKCEIYTKSAVLSGGGTSVRLQCKQLHSPSRITRAERGGGRRSLCIDFIPMLDKDHSRTVIGAICISFSFSDAHEACAVK